jgi:hypothetical protein
MKAALRLVLLAAAVAMGLWLWTILFPSPEKIIRQRLTRLAADVSFRPGQNLLLAANRAEQVADFFSTNVEVTVNVPGHSRQILASRSDILQAVAAARQQVRGLQVEFLDVAVTVAPDKQSAVAELTARARITGEQELTVQELKFTFQKIGGEWLITRVETVRTLSLNPPPGRWILGEADSPASAVGHPFQRRLETAATPKRLALASAPLDSRPFKPIRKSPGLS